MELISHQPSIGTEGVCRDSCNAAAAISSQLQGFCSKRFAMSSAISKRNGRSEDMGGNAHPCDRQWPQGD